MHYTFLDALGLIFRWLHIVAATAAVGGPIFIYLVLLPVAGTLPDAGQRSVQEGVRRRWGAVVRIAITFLILSGSYNFLTFLRASRTWGPEWQSGPAHLYQALFGVKMLLALAIFFLASVLTGRSPAMARFRDNARFWVGINLTLGIAIVAVSSGLRMMHIGPTPAPAKVEAATNQAEASRQITTVVTTNQSHFE
jgi:uncharacterized membrane protein